MSKQNNAYFTDYKQIKLTLNLELQLWIRITSNCINDFEDFVLYLSQFKTGFFTKLSKCL